MDLYCREEDVDEVDRWLGLFQLRVVETEEEVLNPVDADQGFRLRYHAGVLALERGGDRGGVFIEGREVQRRLKGDFALGRACGIQRNVVLEILDATGGLGVDGLALAVAGQRMVLMERNEALWAMLDNLIERLALDNARAVLGDSAELILNDEVPHNGLFDVVYFDPMFPPRNKTALPGKRMQYLEALLENTAPFDQKLIDVAKSRARSRVVLKRRLKDPVVGRVDWQIRGRAVRYDVYRGLAPDRQPSRRTA